MRKYRLITASGREVATFTGYPEAVLSAAALAHAEPLALDGPTGLTEVRGAAGWADHVEKLRALFAPAVEEEAR